MEKFKELQLEINNIKKRNKRVEADKAWETSLFRRLVICLLTYLVIVLFMIVAALPKPFINALVPTLGFILSTLTVSFIKKYWIKKYIK